MKNRIFVFFAVLTIVLTCTACNSSGNTLGPGDMLDTDTKEIYSIGDSRERFDDAFGHLGTSESDGRYGLEVEYLGGVLTVTYQDGVAVSIECEGGTNRFEFYNFNFSMDISKIKGRYKETTTAGYIFYSRYYDSNGKDVDRVNATTIHTLMVRDGDLLNMKDGQFLQYSVEDTSSHWQ